MTMTSTQSPTLTALATALAKAQGAIAPAHKDAMNPHFRSHYASLASIVEAVRPALAANGLSVVQTPLAAPAGSIALETRLLHASGEWIAGTASIRIVKDDPQGAGSGLTYLRRYALAAMIGVMTTEDDDANAASAPLRAEPPRSAPVPRPPTPAPVAATVPVPVTHSPEFAAALKAEPRRHIAERADEQIDESGPVTLVYCQTKGGETRGRAWTSYRIGWKVDGGETVFATTFDSATGEFAESAKRDGQRVVVSTRTTERGVNIVGIAYAAEDAAQEAVNEIPF